MSDTNRRGFLRGVTATGLGASTLVGSAAASTTSANTIVVEDYFHYEIGDEWTIDSDLPTQPGGSEPIEHHLTHHTGQTASKWFGGCFEAGLSGDADDGTIWIEQPVDVDPNTTYDVTLEFAGYNQEQSYNKIVSGNAYFGNDNPETEADILSRNNDNALAIEGDLHSADDQWVYYDTTGEFTSDGSSTAWVALGMNIFWETSYYTNLFDDLYLELTPK
ncbi:hypothetical protein [Halovivax limisalsi]|uniref:hypothetical protein n=1 Tax=Halovivax limisalsi TaxID=1453760 RepID=UPI001FFD3080|nr:hypothetical protein [Halovivax limisalsi]